jgi:beta-galactosidase
VFSSYNVPVDFIHRKDLENGDLSAYKLIILPFPVMFTQKAADGLKTFVEKGGYALAEARLAWNDDRGYATEIIPGMGLNEVFGVRESKVEVKEEVPMEITNTSHPAVEGFSEGEILKGNYFAESVDPASDQDETILAILKDGTPCLVASRYGKGETLFLGSFMDNHPEANENNNRFLLGLLDWAKIERPFTSSHDGRAKDPVVIRLHENPEGWLLYVLNQGLSPEKVSIRLSVPEAGNYSMEEIISGHRVSRRSDQKMLEIITGEIPGSDAEIYKISQE